MTEIKKDAVYYRVSTTDQNPENQIVAVSEWLSGQGVAPSDVAVYEDRVSGIATHRPNLLRLINDIKSGKVKRVIVWRLDRLGRSLKQLIELIDLFGRNGVAFISIKESFDTSTSAGKLMFHLIGSMAQFERDLISERAKMAVRKRMAEGHKVGRQKGAIDKRRRKTNGYRIRYLIPKLQQAEASYNLKPNKANWNKLRNIAKQLTKLGYAYSNPNLSMSEEVLDD